MALGIYAAGENASLDLGVPSMMTALALIAQVQLLCFNDSLLSPLFTSVEHGRRRMT